MSKRKQHRPEFKAKVALEALKGVRLQSFTEISLVFVTEALVRFLFQFRRQRIDAATGVFGWFVS